MQWTEPLEPRRLLAAVTDVLVPAGATWRYLDTGADAGTAWAAPTFNDAAWRSGAAELGYGDGGEATVVRSGPSTGRYITTYFRRSFGASDIRRYGAVNLELKRDDGAIVYLNGREVARSNMPAGPVNSLTRATLNVAGADESTFYGFALPPSLLAEGSNTLAVEVHQNSSTSGDVSFDLRLSATREEVDNNPFTVVVLPDTQFYSQSYPATFHAQTQWIVDNVQAHNIKFVTHVGDVIEWDADPAFRLTEWQRADAAMDRLDALPALPYSVTVGNHDYEVKDSHLSGAARFVEYFGAARYAGRPWYGGASADQRNHYQVFSAARWSFLHITVEFEASDAALAWAQSVVDAHPGLPTILTTHAYVQGTSGRSTTKRNTDGNSGEQIWQEFVRRNPSVFMVLNGHYPGEAAQTSINAAGQPVFEMLADYQARSEGGQGFLRLLQFHPLENRIDVKTWSPTRNVFETDANSQFSLAINFDQRFPAPLPPPPLPPQPQTLTFQQGASSYAGAKDTRVLQAVEGSAGPNTNLATSPVLDVDDDTPAGSGADAQTLLRFDNLFSDAAGPIPLGSSIASATLTFNVTSAGSGLRLHRMRSAWSDTATWNSLVDGIQPDGVEAAATPDLTLGAPNGSANIPAGVFTLDVTASLRAWSAGATNRGWAVLPLPGGSNGLTMTSSDGTTLSQRPKLTVTFTPPVAQGAAPAVQMLSLATAPNPTQPVPIVRPVTFSNRLALGEMLRSRRRIDPLQFLLA